MCALEARTTQVGSEALIRRYLSSYEGTEQTTLELLQSTAVTSVFESELSSRKKWLEVLERSYSQGIVSEPNIRLYLYRTQEISSMPLEIAQRIAGNPDKYPRYMINIAEERCRVEATSNIVPVADIAARDSWFEDL